jgi:Flp pilus assembly protein TadG
MRRVRMRFMSWLSNKLGFRDERGAVLAFFAVTLVMLLGFTAFTIDFGRIYSERRELQNGADAAALAIATDCAFGDCGSSIEQYNTAEQYADANASDDRAWVDDVTVDLGAQTVRVHASTEESDGDNNFDMMFAQVIGFDDFTVGAEATVAWGAPDGLATLPITFSLCEWNNFAPELFFPWEEWSPTPTEGMVTLFFHGDAEICHDSPSGADLPGGFGWLDTPSGTCETEVFNDGWVADDPGASPSTGCSANIMENLVGTVVLIPYFNEFDGTGAGAEYHIAGFGAFYLTGYNFAGQYKERSLVTGNQVCTGEDRCLEGFLIKDYVVSGTPGGGGTDFGVVVVGFVG